MLQQRLEQIDSLIQQLTAERDAIVSKQKRETAIDAALLAIDERLKKLEAGPLPDPDPLPSVRYAGAEGYAAKVLGGRVAGGRNVVVDNFTDPEFTRADMVAGRYATGTLRWAMHQPGPKRIVFAQPATIRLRAPIQVNVLDQAADMTFNETRVPMTIIGAICMDAVGSSVWLNTRFRAAMWNNGWRPFEGGPQSTGDCLHLNSPIDTLIMNCEFSGGADELFNIKYQLGDTTIQDCVFCEAFTNGDFGMAWGDDGGHNYGAILTCANEGVGRISLIRNYWANLRKRMPTEVYSLPLNPRPQRMVVINNVFYNWVKPCGSFEGKEHSVIAGCTFKTGPSTDVASIVGNCTSAYIVDSILNRVGAESSLSIQPPDGHPTGLRNYNSNGLPVTVVGTSIPDSLATELNAKVLPRQEALQFVLANAGVTPIDNVSRHNRQAFTAGTGWQGASRGGSLDEYLTWATGV